MMSFFLQNGQCVYCCSWKPVNSVWGYPQHTERCTEVSVRTYWTYWTVDVKTLLEHTCRHTWNSFFFLPIKEERCFSIDGKFPNFSTYFLKHPERHTLVSIQHEVVLSEWHLFIFHHLIAFAAYQGFLLVVIKFWIGSEIRFIELREDYKSAKIAARLSSLWTSSSWYRISLLIRYDLPNFNSHPAVPELRKMAHQVEFIWRHRRQSKEPIQIKLTVWLRSSSLDR